MTHPVPLAGVIGSPVAHSRSPALHGHWLRRYKVSGHYIPMDVAPCDLAEALHVLPRLGFVGVNVTLPHKEAALALSHTHTDRAARIGAANTLTFQADGTVHADNTDGFGFMASLHQSAPDWQPHQGPAVVLGAGGAARAILVSLLESGVPEIRLANRTRARAEALCAEFGPRVFCHDWNKPISYLKEARTLVNTTALGMTGKDDLSFPFEMLHPELLVTDIVYTPLETTLLREAAARGATVVDGLGMLLHQAAPGFERWFGRVPEVDAALRAAVLTG
ncbi:shikimate dehydrogenase [Rhodovulum imhoffii]|uniref:Shikimate dehydrogenase (NADP(+)) n=1 Tax=Rhodovulum imhoffii TaxID=365340 RepID=A0A2T5BRM6_9RHOB|nr:shikimate dehydrogenase [Rhodovulum imhoffii]MBK5934036.1 shikimate dehydrogenase [Rhodovulum imhoffii]PTN01921.1 shikimate dehydrogenase [Rhodovulum imhoffii]